MWLRSLVAIGLRINDRIFRSHFFHRQKHHLTSNRSLLLCYQLWIVRKWKINTFRLQHFFCLFSCKPEILPSSSRIVWQLNLYTMEGEVDRGRSRSRTQGIRQSSKVILVFYNVFSKYINTPYQRRYNSLTSRN